MRRIKKRLRAGQFVSLDYGRSYGYPRCCIRFFYNGGWLNYSQKEMEKFKNSPFDGTGYVPCLRCLQKNPDTLRKLINVRRLPYLDPFELISSKRHESRKPWVPSRPTWPKFWAISKPKG